MPTPVRPRHAASLIIHRGDEDQLEVFIGRQPKKARFKPDVYVFPGGMIERSDRQAQPLVDLNPTIASKLAVADSHPRARALAMAAVRETFEETGLLAAAPGDVGPSTDPSWSSFRQRQLAPDLSKLHYLGRAVTPADHPMRFIQIAIYLLSKRCSPHYLALSA
ncbi:MAG: 8-oxo-dGTP pyrophosphatase MutT (NUDIX family) [Gammaproteobacteria bacterium]|jgi:8-oxo-dGTP pyrophosphatase MutT (NUDIX family)